MLELKKIQEMNRTVLNEAARVCSKYGICYYLDSGALLGAVRHKSFIPWDDDVDISFTRHEYQRFKKAVRKEWGSGDYMLVEPGGLSDGAWYDWTVRIVHKAEKWEKRNYGDTGRLDEKNTELIGCHPSIDLFILDVLPDDKRLQRKTMMRLILDYGLAMGHRNDISYSEYQGVCKAAVWILAHLGKHIPLKRIIAAYTKHCTEYQGQVTNSCFFSNYSFPSFRKVYRTEWFQKGSKVRLDGELYNAPGNVHEYLKMTYGDYRKLPPADERKPKHWQTMPVCADSRPGAGL